QRCCRSRTPSSVTPENLPSERKGITHGTSRTWTTDSQLLCVAIDRMEKFGSVSVWHSDSADAIFIGCWMNISFAWTSPVHTTPMADRMVVHQPTLCAGRCM